jgi:hypothetical protein
MEESLIEESESENACADEAAPALIAVHRTESCDVVAVGSELRVFDLNSQVRIFYILASLISIFEGINSKAT